MCFFMYCYNRKKFFVCLKVWVEFAHMREAAAPLRGTMVKEMLCRRLMLLVELQHNRNVVCAKLLWNPEEWIGGNGGFVRGSSGPQKMHASFSLENLKVLIISVFVASLLMQGDFYLFISRYLRLFFRSRDKNQKDGKSERQSFWNKKSDRRWGGEWAVFVFRSAVEAREPVWPVTCGKENRSRRQRDQESRDVPWCRHGFSALEVCVRGRRSVSWDVCVCGRVGLMPSKVLKTILVAYS